MTRKRFVKRLMSRGWSRNDANMMAAIARGVDSSYKDHFEQLTDDRLGTSSMWYPVRNCRIRLFRED